MTFEISAHRRQFHKGNFAEQFLGDIFEADAIRELQDAGYEVNCTQVSFSFQGRNKETLVTGHIDGMIKRAGDDGRAMPVEIKSMNQYDWEKMNCVDDLLHSDKHWQMKYPAQLTLYMLIADREEGLFLLFNKMTYVPKQINMKLDMAYAEALLAKAERINAAVLADEVPDRMPYTDNLCGRCDFVDVCLPGFEAAEGVEWIDDVVVEGLLEIREKVQDAASEYNRVDKKVKEILKRGPAKWAVGDWYVERTTTPKSTRFKIRRIIDKPGEEE